MFAVSRSGAQGRLKGVRDKQRQDGHAHLRTTRGEEYEAKVHSVVLGVHAVDKGLEEVLHDLLRKICACVGD